MNNHTEERLDILAEQYAKNLISLTRIYRAYRKAIEIVSHCASCTKAADILRDAITEEAKP